MENRDINKKKGEEKKKEVPYSRKKVLKKEFDLKTLNWVAKSKPLFRASLCIKSLTQGTKRDILGKYIK